MFELHELKHTRLKYASKSPTSGIILFFSLHAGSIGTLPDRISWVRPLNRGNSHTYSLSWYLQLLRHVYHPLGTVWVMNHHHQSSTCMVATGSSIQQPPSSHLLLPHLPPWLPYTAPQQSSQAWPDFTASFWAWWWWGSGSAKTNEDGEGGRGSRRREEGGWWCWKGGKGQRESDQIGALEMTCEGVRW